MLSFCCRIQFKASHCSQFPCLCRLLWSMILHHSLFSVAVTVSKSTDSLLVFPPFGIVWWFSHDLIGFVGFWRETHRTEVPSSSHCMKGSMASPDRWPLGSGVLPHPSTVKWLSSLSLFCFLLELSHSRVCSFHVHSLECFGQLFFLFYMKVLNNPLVKPLKPEDILEIIFERFFLISLITCLLRSSIFLNIRIILVIKRSEMIHFIVILKLIR